MKNSYGGVEGCRDYDTLTSRWTAPDPMGDAGGDDDWYGCCLDDPVNGVDPLGLMGEGLFGRLFSQLGILFSPNEADAAELSTDMEAGTTTFDPRPEIPKGKLTTIETRNRVTRNSAPGADGPFNTDDVQVLKAMPKSRQKSFGPDGHILILLILEEETSMEVEGKSLKTRLNLAKDGIQQKGVQGVKTRMSSSLVKTFLIFKNDSQESKYLMNVSRVVIIALVLIGLGACTAKTYQGQRGLKCLGPICLERGKRDIDAEPFFEKHGVGLERKGKFPAYWYMDAGTFVYISRYHGENRPIESIVVSKYPYYSKRSLPPKQSFGSLVTEKGIELGATLEEVVSVYGQPNQLYTYAQGLKGQLPETWSSVNPENIIIARYENVYAEDDYGPWSLFFFENDVLIAMELSNAL